MEYDTSYQYIFEKMRIYVHDINELSIISNTHTTIKKIISVVYVSYHYGCCMRHIGENILNNFYNSKIVSHFCKASKAYDRFEFYDHFNQIRAMVLKTAEHLECVRFHK